MRIIAGSRKNREILAPEGHSTRPTSNRLRESVFNILQYEIQSAHFLDLFAGSGAMGLEALSRGADHAVFVELDPYSVKLIERNTKQLEFEKQSDIYRGDVFSLLGRLAKMNRKFDVIYADPPYDSLIEGIPCGDALLAKIEEGGLLKEGGKVFLEEGSRYRPNIEALKTLKLKRSKKMGRSTLHEFETGPTCGLASDS